MASDFSSIDLSLVKTHLDTSDAEIVKLAPKLEALLALQEKVYNASWTRIVEFGQIGIDKSFELLGTWRENDAATAVVYNTLIVDGDCVVHFNDSTVNQALRDAGLNEAPDIIDADAGEMIGMPPTSGYADDPICTANGNFVHQETDISLVGYAQVIDVERTYNALAGNRNGVFGKGWTSMLDMGVEVNPDSDLVRVALADGASVPFRYDTENERFEPNTRRRLKLERVETEGVFDGWVLSNADDQTWRFDVDGTLSGGSSGHASFTVDRNEKSVAFTEAQSQRWVRYFITDGLVTHATSSDGRRSVYSYDGDGFCVDVQRPGSGVTYEIADGLITAIVDADGVLVCRNTYDTERRVVSQENPHGAVSTYDYLESRVTKVSYGDDGPTNLYSHDAQGNVTAMFGGDGAAMRMSWDNQNRMTKVVDRGGHVTTYEFDDDNDVLLRRVDPDGLGESYGYDDKGRVVSETDRAGSTQHFTYSGDSTVPSKIVDVDSSETIARYDDRDLPTEVVDSDGVKTEFMWDDDGQLTSIISATGARSTFVYDRVGRLSKIIDPLGKTASYSYDDDGHVKSATDVDDIVRRYTSTAAGRILSCASDAPGSWSATYNDAGLTDTVTDATDATTRYVYDRFGQLVEYIDPNDTSWQQQFDPLGRLTETTSPTGATTIFGYNKAGHQTTIVNADGVRTERNVDWLGRTTKLTEPGNITRSWGYHPNGELATYTDPTGGTFNYNIDNFGRLASEVDPEGNTNNYRYSSTGQLIETTSAAGRTYTFGYDNAGRLVTIGNPDGVTVTTEYRLDGQVKEFQADGASTTLTYDEAGRVTGWSATDVGETGTATFYPDAVEVKKPGAGTSRFDIDPRGLLAKAADPAGVVTKFTSDAAGRVIKTQTGTTATTFGYDNAGRLATIVDPLGNETLLQRTPSGQLTDVSIGQQFGRHYNYDRAGRVESVETPDGQQLAAYNYDHNNQIVEATNPNGTVRIERDRYGKPATVHNIDGTETSYQRDADGMVTSRTASTGQTTNYVRSPSGDLTGFDDPDAGHIAVPEEPADRTRDQAGRITVDQHGRTYRYDTAGRIAEAVTDNGERYEFNYNDLGLLATDTTPQHGQRTYTYNAAGGLTQTSSDHGTTQYTYDAAGRRTSEQHPDGRSVDYTWNDLNQLLSFTHTTPDGNQSTTTVTYSALGRPEKIGDVTIGWDDAITGKPIRIGDKRYLRSGTQTRACESDAEWDDGIVDDPYGYETPTSDVEFGYRGELTIDGLVFMGDRVYQPETRSFLTTDPLPAVPGQNTYASPYVYAYNDPINYLDPTGRRPLLEEEFQARKTEMERNAWDKYGKTALTVTSMALDFVPVVGNVKGVVEGVVGYDMAGNKLEPWERALGLAGPFGKGAKYAAKGAGALGTAYGVYRGAKAIKNGQKFAAASQTLAKTAEKMQQYGARAKGYFSQFEMAPTMNMGFNFQKKKIPNSSGELVERTLVRSQDELLDFANDAAGGSLDNLDEFKPGWWQGKKPDGGTVKIEWEPTGHPKPINEGPHVTVRQLKDPMDLKSGWKVTDKAFIEGQEKFSG